MRYSKYNFGRYAIKHFDWIAPREEKNWKKS